MSHRMLRDVMTAAPQNTMSSLDMMTQLKVADLEYTVGDYHGWLVLRAAMSDRDDTCIVFDSPFTISQHNWLVMHHRPQVHMRSWLVIGRRRQSTSINEWLAVPAVWTSRFVQGCPTYAEACRYIGARVCQNLTAVLDALRSQ